MVRRVYWDACTFLGLINQEADKHSACLKVWNEAEQGMTIIYTSFFTWSEVFKVKCDSPAKPLDSQSDVAIQAMLSQPFIEGVVVDEGIGLAARRLMRQHPECKKPSDSIHLATALRLSVDEMHTFDGSDLLGLSGRAIRADGIVLTICHPAPMPAKKVELPPAPLLQELEDKADE